MSVRAAHSGAALRVYTFAEARGPRRLSGRWRELGAWRWGGRDNWERTAPLVSPHALTHDVGQHVEKPRMVVDRRGAGHRQADLATDRGRFGVEVVQDLDVVAHEADRHDRRGREALLLRSAQVVAYVRLEPGILAKTAVKPKTCFIRNDTGFRRCLATPPPGRAVGRLASNSVPKVLSTQISAVQVLDAILC